MEPGRRSPRLWNCCSSWERLASKAARDGDIKGSPFLSVTIRSEITLIQGERPISNFYVAHPGTRNGFTRFSLLRICCTLDGFSESQGAFMLCSRMIRETLHLIPS